VTSVFKIRKNSRFLLNL